MLKCVSFAPRCVFVWFVDVSSRAGHVVVMCWRLCAYVPSVSWRRVVMSSLLVCVFCVAGVLRVCAQGGVVLFGRGGLWACSRCCGIRGGLGRLGRCAYTRVAAVCPAMPVLVVSLGAMWAWCGLFPSTRWQDCV